MGIIGSRGKVQTGSTISTYWGSVGNSLEILDCGYPALAALNGTDVAFIDNFNDNLRTYRFDGTTWAQVGSGIGISFASAPALAALNSTDVAFIDRYNRQLRTYRFNGTNWALVGSGLTIGGTDGFPALTALNSTDVAFIDDTNKSLRTYRFNGTSWSLVGSGLTIASILHPAMTALSDCDIAFIDDSNESLRTYRFNGTTWAQIGNGLAITGIGYPALAALNGTDVALIDGDNDSLRTYRFDWTDWTEVVSSPTGGISYQGNALALLSTTGYVASINNTDDTLKTSSVSTDETKLYAAEVVDFSISESAEVRDDSGVGDEWDRHLVVLRSWSGSVSCYWDDTDTDGQGALSVGEEVVLTLIPDSDDSSTYFSGTGVVSSLNMSVSNNAIITASFSVTGKGALTRT